MARRWPLAQDDLRTLVSASRIGVISDFDGTLSSIVPDPLTATITPENERALRRLLRRVAVVAIVSGRSVTDLRDRFLLPAIHYVGNHGLEYWNGAAVELAAAVRPWQAPLRQLLHDFGAPPEPGILIEDKGVIVTIHYRLAADPAGAGRRLEERLLPLCARYGLRLQSGRFVWEVVPPVAINKGTAVRQIVEDERLDGVIFLGDDRTDLLAMEAITTLRQQHHSAVRGLTVGVLSRQETPVGLEQVADLLADGPDDVARLLSWFADQLPDEVLAGQRSSTNADTANLA